MPQVAHSSEFVTTPVEITEAIPPSLTNGTRKITEWTATVESVTWSGKTYDLPWQAVVDTGTYSFNVPRDLASDINAAFDPPAVYLPDSSDGPVYSVQCNATPPAGVGIQLGGKMIRVESRDMIWRDWDGQCFSTVAPSGSLGDIELFFLGDYFLRNVVAVFDFGKNEMRWAERYHDSNSSSSGSGPAVVPATGSATFLESRWLTISLVCMIAVATWL